MGHRHLQSGYSRLAERLNRFPLGAPPTRLLFEILRMLFSEREAGLVALLPIKPFTVEQAARAWKTGRSEAQGLLDGLASRAILVDMAQDGQSRYVLPPPMAGFFEFSLMRVREDLDQKVLSELFYRYLNVEEDFIRTLFTHGETRLGRTFVSEPALSEENALEVLDYERASEVIRSASHRGVSLCYCRHKMKHLGRACGAPMEICMTFGTTASSLIRHGYARTADKEECLDLLSRSGEHNLVQFGENVRTAVNFLCNCCGCCCEAMIAARRFAFLHPVHTTRFMPEIDPDSCIGCGKCVEVCPVEAISLVSACDPHRPKRKKARREEEICLGCGVCVRACPCRSIRLVTRSKRVITPVNSTHRVVMMAIERGTFAHLIFDQRVLWSHRALAGVLGVILRLPPWKQLLACRQVKSRYLEALLRSRSS